MMITQTEAGTRIRTTGETVDGESGGSTPTGVIAGSSTARVRAARRGLAVFVGFLALLSVPLYVVLAARALPVAQQPGLILLMMWTPALAAVATRLLLREGFRGTGLAVLGRAAAGHAAVAVALPVVVGALSYGAAWGLGLASFTASAGAASGVDGLALAIARAVVIGTPLGVITVAGEEIGFRGYMTERLRTAGLRAPGLVGGLIWAAWHTPLILTGQYAGGPNALLSVFGFAVLAVGLHMLWSAWKLETGSLWPAVVGHSAWNAVIQHPFDGHTAGEAASVWVGDAGLLTAGLLLVFALCLLRLRPAGQRKEKRV